VIERFDCLDRPRVGSRFKSDKAVLLLNRLDDGHKAPVTVETQINCRRRRYTVVVAAAVGANKFSWQMELERQLANFGQHSRLDDLRQDVPLVPFNIYLQVVDDGVNVVPPFGCQHSVDGIKALHRPLVSEATTNVVVDDLIAVAQSDVVEMNKQTVIVIRFVHRRIE